MGASLRGKGIMEWDKREKERFLGGEYSQLFWNYEDLSYDGVFLGLGWGN